VTRAALALCVVLLASGCDELVEQVPCPAADHQAWSTAQQAATAVCSQQCRWARACLTAELPADELASCNATCVAYLSADAPAATPAGTDAQLDACVRGLYTYTQAPDACRLAAPPTLSACLDLARPAP
jgi:hypothetical protein